MNILYFSRDFGAPTTTFIRNETEFFKKEHNIKYICTELHPNSIKPDYVSLILYLTKTFKDKIKGFLWKYDLLCDYKNKKFSQEINSLIVHFNPQIIHCHFGFEALMLLDNLENFDNHKIIIHFNGYDASMMTQKKSYVRRLKYYLSKSNVWTISCNQYFLDYFNNELNIKMSKSFNLKYGVNIESTFLPDSNFVSGEESIFIQVASLYEKKGHEYTIHAFKKFKESLEWKKSKLIFIGNGYKELFLKELVKKLNLVDDIVFLGTLRPHEISEKFNKASVFVHHSITDKYGNKEGIPVAIMEAMAMELPIVSTSHSGIPELVEDGVNGYLVNEKDIDAYAHRLGDALKMGRLPINRKKIIEHFNLAAHNHNLAEIYNEFVKIKI